MEDQTSDLPVPSSCQLYWLLLYWENWKSAASLTPSTRRLIADCFGYISCFIILFSSRCTKHALSTKTKFFGPRNWTSPHAVLFLLNSEHSKHFLAADIIQPITSNQTFKGFSTRTVGKAGNQTANLPHSRPGPNQNFWSCSL